MILRNLRLVNFRRYSDSIFEFHDKTNFINGNNGSGKTSILEAAHYLSLTKSFRTNSDYESVNYQSGFFSIFGEFSNIEGRRTLFNMNYSKSEGRSFLIDKTQVRKYTDIVGRAPVVILSPGLQKITEGGPSERRNFINRIISQIDHNYFYNLIEYKSRLLQRNAALGRYREKNIRFYDEYFEAQDEILSKIGADLLMVREAFINTFRPIFKNIFKHINHTDSIVDINIKTSIKTNTDSYSKTLFNNLRERYSRDLMNARTGCGPHLDDIILLFNGKEIRQIGSQGEHKLVLIALKLAEGIYLEACKGEPIIFLLDDLFAFLDVEHCRKIVDEIGGKNQTLITSTDIKELRKYGFRKTMNSVKIINLSTGEA